MCGILALVSFKNHEHNLSRLDEMARMIKHRGPDDEGYALFDVESSNYRIFYGDDTPKEVIDSNLKFAPKNRCQYPGERFSVGLVHRRLSIIDLSATGHQPMSDETGRFWITYNGEIYNFKEIREELKKLGYSFFSNTDTEVVLKSYMAWGKGCQSKFNGMWALVIWDNVEKLLWISRDRFGVKPLYYMFHDGFFIVCSEIKSIMPITDLPPNFQEMYAFLLDGQSEAHDETFFKNVYRFPSGYSAFYKAREGLKEIKFDRYWELKSPTNENSFSERRLKDSSEEYYHLLKDAVRIRLFADVKVSCALSGGLDSSSITFLADQIIRENGNNTESLVTVSNVYKNEKYSDCDESSFIDSVVKSLNVKSFKSEPDDMQLREKNDYGLWCHENCHEWLSVAYLNTFEICKRNNIKVNLDGQGADETNAGYPRYWRNAFAMQSFNKEYLTSLLFAPISYRQKIRSVFRRDGTSTPGSIIKNRFGIKINDEYRAKRVIKNNFVGISVNEALQNSITFNLKILLRNVDSDSMANSIESRQPFMDYRLISFLNSIPSNYKLHNGWTKYLARIAFKGKLPDNIVWRKDKLGWPQPLRHWISGNFGLQAYNNIKESKFLKELLKTDISEETLSLVIKQPRPFLRLYNLARHYEIFYNSEDKGVSSN